MEIRRERWFARLGWRLCEDRLAMFRTRLEGRLGRLADTFSTPKIRFGRRQLRRWLSDNGLILVVVTVMMVIAWMVAGR